MLHERGLAYQAESLVNYDPVDQTVLANEQVDAHGRSWRSGAKVEKVMLKQWFLNIKEYQRPLLDDLKVLAKDGRWPEKVLAMQKNWIGKSEGAKIRFDVSSPSLEEPCDPLEVFTTRADTLFGVQYIALSFGHPIVQQQALGDASLRAFIERAKELPSDTKEGYLLPNITAINPIAEHVSGVGRSLPVYVAPYVLDNYGSGAVMGVPGHDTRDHAFWRANMGSEPIRMVVTAKPDVTPSPLLPGSDQDKPLTARGYVAADIDGFKGLLSRDAARKVVAFLSTRGKRAGESENWRLRDWLISRQRYWGTPIPIIHCHSCGPVPVPEQDLPVKLPNLPDSFFDGRKGNPLAEDETWKKTECPKCGSAAERETDTMDTFMDSSWYFFRFLDPKNDTAPIDPRKADEGMPVDLYVGGVEHAILHLLYARFISKFLASTSAWPRGKFFSGEPFKRLITQGMVHGETFTDPENGRFLRPDELDLTTPSAPRIKASGLTPTVSYEKMSKSKYNGVDPGATIAMYGADATRAHMLFQAPVGDVLEWDPKKITGVQRWLIRIIRLSSGSLLPEDVLAGFEVPTNPDLELLDILKHLAQKEMLERPQTLEELSRDHTENQLLASLTKQDYELWIKTQQTIASVNGSFSQTYSLNTVVSDLMTLTNAIYDCPNSSAATPYLKWYATAHLVRMLAPVAPGVAEEAWNMLTGACDTSSVSNSHGFLAPTVFAAGFPIADLDIVPRLVRTVKCVVQVEGKRKFEVDVDKDFGGNVFTDKKNMSRWLLNELLKNKEGKEWLDLETGKVWQLSQTKQPHRIYKLVPDDWNFIIVNSGRLCNLVGPKRVKAKKSTSNPAAVSEPFSEEQEVMALKNNSNGKRSWASDHDKVSKTAPQQILQHGNIRQELEDMVENLDNTTSQNATIGANHRIEVHRRVGKLIASLPSYLRPRYVPPDLLPVPRSAICHAVSHSGQPIPSEGILTRYEEDVASFGTPGVIALKHVIDASASELASMNRETLIMKYNAIFPDQLMILSYPHSTHSHISPLLSKHRYFIRQKLRLYRAWINNQADEKGGTIEMPFASLEQDFKAEVAGKDKLEYLRKPFVATESEKVFDIWEQIISLWAGKYPKKWIVRTQEVQVKEAERREGEQRKVERQKAEKQRVEEQEAEAWTGLVEEDPNLGNKPKKPRLPKWGSRL
jgi:leucyl-tRNA synthetase